MNHASDKCPTCKELIYKLEKSVGQDQLNERFVHRFASVMALLLMLAVVGVVAMVTFAELLMGYPKRLKRLRDDHKLVTRRQESLLGKPDITTRPDSYRGSDDRASFKGAAEGSGYRGGLDSSSWRSNRLCG